MFDIDNGESMNVGIYDPNLKFIVIEKEEVEAFDFRGIKYLFSTMSGNKECLDNYKSNFTLCLEHGDNPEDIMQFPELVCWLNESVRLNIPWFYYLTTDEHSDLPLFIHSYVKSLAQNKIKNSSEMELDEYDAGDFMEMVFRNLNAFTEKYGICADTNREISEQLYHFYLSHESMGSIHTAAKAYGMHTEQDFTTECEHTDFDFLHHRAKSVGNINTEDYFNAKLEVAKMEIPITQPGDVWLIGRHRLVCGDFTDMDAVSLLMNDKKASMIFTIPPWDLAYGSAKHPDWGKWENRMSEEDFRKYLLSALNTMFMFSESGANTYVVSTAEVQGILMPLMDSAGFQWSSTIVWVKDAHEIKRKDYHSQHEFIWYGWQNDAKRLCPLYDRNQSDVWQISLLRWMEENHTTKPIALAMKAINNSSQGGDIILDVFGNSGITLMAAEQTGRTAHLLEADPRYCDAIALRFAKMQRIGADIFLLRNGNKIPYNEI